MSDEPCAMSKNEIILNFKKGLDMEYRSLDAYKKFSSRLENKVDKNIIEMIIADEKEHIAIVEDLISDVNEYI